MPWEEGKVSIKQESDTVLTNRTFRHGTHAYTFDKVFGMNSSNRECFECVCVPLLDSVLNGYNAILFAYGQTGSGKTHTMIGKPEQKVRGLLSMSFEYLLSANENNNYNNSKNNNRKIKSRILKNILKFEISGIEAYGTHVSRIELFDLFDKENSNQDWLKRNPNSRLNPKDLISIEVKTVKECNQRILVKCVT